MSLPPVITKAEDYPEGSIWFDREATENGRPSTYILFNGLWTEVEQRGAACQRAEGQMSERPLEYISELRRGDIVRNRATHQSYVIDTNYTHFAIAVQTITITNPPEWILIERAK